MHKIITIDHTRFCQFCGELEVNLLGKPNYCPAAPSDQIAAMQAEIEELRGHLRQLHFTVSSICHLRGKQTFGDQLRQMHNYLEAIRPLIGGKDLDQQQTEREPTAARD
jgi:FtsZ-binding cell division protein ZapB